MEKQLEVVSAKGVTLSFSDGQTAIDSISSWWCVIHGYRHPILDQVMRDQCDKMSHVMLGGLTHQPAEKLAKKLIDITPIGINHIFFSDSGSVGCEVALKTALQFWFKLKITLKTILEVLKVDAIPACFFLAQAPL